MPHPALATFAPTRHRLSDDLSIRPRLNGFAIVREVWFIGRDGNKDCIHEVESEWPTEAEARAALAQDVRWAA